MPKNNDVDDTEDTKRMELEETIRQRDCWIGHSQSQDIYEIINGEKELIGYFGLCRRRTYPKLPSDNLTEIEKQRYQTDSCELCQYEWTDKWPKNIILKGKRLWNEETKKETTVPITSLSKQAILDAIRQFIENGTKGELVITHSDKTELIQTEPIQEESFDEVPF